MCAARLEYDLTPYVQDRFDTLYRETFNPLVRRVGRKLAVHADGEDIVARAFIKLWQQIETGFRDDLGARLNAIIQNETADYWRGRYRSQEDPEGLNPSRHAGNDAREERLMWISLGRTVTPEDVEFHTSFDQALRTMPDPIPFILTELRGLTIREAARVLESSKTDVARRTEAARTYLTKELT